MKPVHAHNASGLVFVHHSSGFVLASIFVTSKLFYVLGESVNFVTK